MFALVTTWAAAEHWYRDVAGLVRLRVLPVARQPGAFLSSWTPVVWVASVGVLAAVVWEF